MSTGRFSLFRLGPVGSAPEPALGRGAVWACGAALALLLLAAYWPALQGGMLWDDPAHLTAPALRRWSGLWRIWTEPGATQQYYPVLHSLFWLEYHCWGTAMLGYHLATLAEHWIACCLFAALLGNGRWGWTAAAIFALHPLHAESVAWISEQKNTLSLLCALGACCLYVWSGTPAARWVPRLAPYLGATGFFLLALGAKSVTATVPAALLVAVWWQRGDLRRHAVALLPWLAIGLGAGLVTARIEHTLVGAAGSDYAVTRFQHVFLATRIAAFYLRHALWPAHLIFIYPHWNPAAAISWWPSLAAVFIITAIACAAARRGPRGPAAAWLIFLGCLFPALGFVAVYPFRFSWVADHFQYLADLAPCAALGWAAAKPWPLCAAQIETRRWPASCLALAALAVLTHLQAAEYASSASLYQATLAKNPDCWMAHNNLGVELAAEPATRAEAIAHYRAALRLKPDYAEAHNNLGNALAKDPSQLAAAIEEFRAALATEPRFAEARYNLRHAQARISYNAGVAFDAQPGGETDARRSYEEALRLAPDYALAHSNLAVLLAQAGDLPGAQAHWETAVRLDPKLEAARRNLAILRRRSRPAPNTGGTAPQTADAPDAPDTRRAPRYP